MSEPEITRYYTFGFNHAHAVGGFTYDKDIVVKITAPDPRAVMFQMFGRQWSMEYREKDLDLSYYPRGIKDLMHTSAPASAPQHAPGTAGQGAAPSSKNRPSSRAPKGAPSAAASTREEPS